MNKPAEKINFRALGTGIYAEIVFGANEEKERAKTDLKTLENLYCAKQKIFCRFSPESELSQLNKSLNKFNGASQDILYLAERALFYNQASGELYDPRVIEILEKIGYQEDFRKADFSKVKIPANFDKIERDLSEDLKIKNSKIFFTRRMDFSGIAKGYITDCAAKFLKKQGWKNFLIDSGGDIFAAGKNVEEEKWRIEIESIPKEKLMLEISERGIATSGISRKKWQIGEKKFHHLVNPKNPNEFSFELRTVTVIEKNAENADGRAKVLVLLGKRKGLEFAKKNKIAAVFLDYKGNIFASPAAKKYFLTPN